MVNSLQFNDVAGSLFVALPGDIYRSFLLDSAIYFLKVFSNMSDMFEVGHELNKVIMEM